MERIEQTILRNLIFNEEYCRKVLPFIRNEYFDTRTDRILFEEISSFLDKFNTLPTKEVLSIETDSREDITGDEMKIISDLILSLDDAPVEQDWLEKYTEKWCRDRAIYLALMESIKIADGGDEKKNRDAIPAILSDALAVSFDPHVGHDYLEDFEARYDSYHKKEDKIPFDLEYFNKITKGGLPNKTLNVALAGTGVGKSLFMCHMASSCLLDGHNVLYITMEMAEEKIAERIDANLLNVPIQEMTELPKVMFETKVNNLSKKTQGKLIIKEYPTGQAHSGHFRALLNELKLKKKFVPDIVYIDYLNICTSSRMKGVGGSINTYSYIKAIAEELRGLAVEFDIPIMSATQTTRSGFSNSDPGLEDTSESFGLPATADLMLALVSNDELQSMNQILVKQLKNRYADPNVYKRFVIGVDRSKMKLYDVDDAEKELVQDVDNGPVFDQTPSGKKLNTEGFQI